MHQRARYVSVAKELKSVVSAVVAKVLQSVLSIFMGRACSKCGVASIRACTSYGKQLLKYDCSRDQVK